MAIANEVLLGKIETLRNLMLSRATTPGPWEPAEYSRLRRELMDDPRLRKRLPRVVATSFTLNDFWGFISSSFKTYRERREYLRGEFAPVLSYLEGQQSAPADEHITGSLKAWGPAEVHGAWQKALERREGDPEGAITAARTLLETTCKHILVAQGVAFDDKDDLPSLYRAAAKTLKLAPEQHAEDIFKRILGGCQSVVNGLGSLRNELGDAHGKSPGRVRPAPRHAALAVNLAGTMAMFLAETFEAAKRAST